MSLFKFRYLLPILFFIACSEKRTNEDAPLPLLSQPQNVEIDTKDGYIINPTTGDSIKLLKLKNGDTLITGRPFKVTGRKIHSDSVAKPNSYKVPSESSLTRVNAHPYIQYIPENLNVIEVNKEELVKINERIKDDKENVHIIINQSGDTIKTGISHPIKGKKVKALQPKSVKAHPPGFKDAANSNIQYFDVDQGMSSSYARIIMEDSKGNIWIGTDGTGVSLYDGEYYTHFTTKEGIVNDNVYSIIEDRKGNIWIGTDGGGISVYDGKYFTNFSEKEGLSNNMIMSILEDKKGDIWIGTFGGGLIKYEEVSIKNGTANITHFTHDEGLSSNMVMSVLEDKKGNIWIGTTGKGVNKFDGKYFTHYTYNDGLTDDVVLSMLIDKQDNIWIGTYEGLNKLNLNKTNTNPLASRKETITHYTMDEGLSENVIWTMKEDKNGNIWFGTWGGGLNKYNGQAISNGQASFTHITQNQGLSNDVILSIMEDKSGNMWFGTWGGGVSRYNPNSFTHFTQNDGLSNEVVLSILEDKSGNIWFGTNGGGVNKYDGEFFTHYNKEEGLSGNVVTSILEDKDGNLWFGTYGDGVSVLTMDKSIIHNNEQTSTDNSKFYHLKTNQGLTSNVVRSLLEDKDGNIWIGSAKGYIDESYLSDGGVSKLNLNGESFTENLHKGQINFIHYTQNEGLTNADVLSLKEDKNGNIWIGYHGGGIGKIEPHKFTEVKNHEQNHHVSFTYFTQKEGLSTDNIMSVIEGDGNEIWYGTLGNGLGKLTLNEDNSGFFTNVTNHTEINPITGSILKDSKNSIWLATENGLNNILWKHKDSSTQDNVGSENATYLMNKFNKNDGLKGLDFYLNSVYLDSKNRIWWGSGKGLTMLDLDQYSIAKNPPKIFLRDIYINEQFIDYHNISEELSKTIVFDSVENFENYPLNLKIPYNNNHLTFHFSAVDWAAQHKIQYSFRLLGQSEKWSLPTDEAKIDYRELPYGNYTFEVKAIGESQEWSESFQYTFVITPPWWHTGWFRALMVVCAIVLLNLFFKWRTLKLVQRQKELETEIENATQEIRTQKNEVEKQKEQVEVAHKEIKDSINYAERIQRSFLASEELLEENLGDYFVFFQPKEAVSGDFYWAKTLSNGKFALLNADSTGHGVPGAIMSILNISSIESAVKDKLTQPAAIFNETRRIIIERLKKDGSPDGGKDGMDATLLAFNEDRTQMTYVAALNPIWIIRKGELIEIKPEKMPVGKHDHDHIPFVGGEFNLQRGDVIYTITDGFQDQFGGPKGKKYKVRPFKKLILENTHLPMTQQKEIIKTAFFEWKGSLEQVDDVCIIGIKI